MKELTHFIAGKHVKGTSGRFGDIYNPSLGEVQAKVPFAAKGEMRQAVEAALKAFPEWSSVNPQRRARVMFNFKALVEKDMDRLARMLSDEHGKVLADSRGDVQRGIEVIEFACGIPHLQKGEYTEGAGPGIDIYSMRQPLGVVAGITPFNFPAMIPMWMFGVAIACGNCFINKPSEKDPSVPLRLAELFMEAGAPAGVLQVVNGDKGRGRRDPRRSRHPGGEFRWLVCDRAIRLFARHRERQARAGDGRGQEPRHHHARRRSRPGDERVDRGGLRLGRRALHGDLGRGADH